MIGLAIGVGVYSGLRSLLFNVSPFDPVTMILASAAVFVLAIVASALPARRAASVDPLQALRGE
jgi:ABC-type antimicrobial peptide transport system permease subunit